MSTEQMRKEFEAWAEENHHSTKTDNVGYCHPCTTMAWQAWQASRAALVVEVPKFDDWPTSMEIELQESFTCALEAAGITIKP